VNQALEDLQELLDLLANLDPKVKMGGMV